jgi:hypothetical protein
MKLPGTNRARRVEILVDQIRRCDCVCQANAAIIASRNRESKAFMQNCAEKPPGHRGQTQQSDSAEKPPCI